MTDAPDRSKSDLPPLAVALKAYRARHGLTQREFAALVHVPAARIRDFEQAGLSPDTHLAKVAAWALDAAGE
ncbi:helix-turn-helix transcriptional regulator [Sphingomonas sp. SCN 67-18]|uniref:helix-turn-helix domain-containing protein n=1 Tax=uncultured Sphingomonas sp. TaxID=158754 RepID=UPI00341AC7BB